MLKVAQLIGSTGVFGAERWILALMNYLDPKEVDSIIINLVDEYTSKESPIVIEAKKRGLKAVDFYTAGKFNPFSAKRLADWLDENQYNIIHSHGYKSDFVAWLAKKNRGKFSIISTPHGWSKEPDLKLKFYEYLDRKIFKFFDKVCPLSEDIMKSLIEANIDKKKIKLILNAVDIAEIDKHPVLTDWNNEVVIGYIGQLIARKNLGLLIKSFSKVIDRLKTSVKLVIVGDGVLRGELSNYTSKLGLEDYVIFTGYRTDRISLLKAFSVFVLPSFLEGIPRCLMEAMAARVPVVASDIEGNRVLVEHKKTGLLFPTNDAQKLSDAIYYILTHKKEAQNMVENARAKIEKDFSARRMAQEYTTVYKEILKR